MNKKLYAILLIFALFTGESFVFHPSAHAGSVKYNGIVESNIVADVAEKIAASVVNIDTEREVKQAFNFPNSPFGNDFFDHFFFGTVPPDKSGERFLKKKSYGNGSGVVIDKNGHILTCHHVIEGAQNIKVTLHNGQKYDAKVVGKDKFSDIAVIKIEAISLVSAPLGNSASLRTGEWVLAIGSPLGYDHSVTLGIISAMSRETDISNVQLLQTDAMINPGNSGGPLVNLKGEVIGINNAIAGIGTGIGFAIPINTVNDILNNLLTVGSVQRPWIGIGMVNLEPNMAKSLGLSEEEKGVVVNQVYPESPAEKAGFKQGDVIKKVDGKDVADSKKIQDIIRGKEVETDVSFLVIRNGRLLALSIKIGKMPND